MKIIISDTGPILTMAYVNRLDLLFSIYPDFFIPEGVFAELRINLPKYSEVSATIIKEITPHGIEISHKEWLKDYEEGLGVREKECLILVKETGINYLLIDDAKARKFAESLGIICIGSLAIFIKAKELGLIREIRPIFYLIANSDRFFQKELMNAILKKFGEEQL